MKPTIIRTNWTDGKGNLLFWSEQENLNPGPVRCFSPDGTELTGTPAENLERGGIANPKVQAYLDWTNNFLTLAKFAEHYGLSLEAAENLIEEGRNVHEASVPVQERVPVTAALLGELADIRNRGNSYAVAHNAFVGAQKGFGPSPAHLAQLRDTLPKPRLFTVVSVSSKANSFGYRGVLVITADGTGFECLYQAYGTDKVPERGDKIEEAKLPTYCRRELPKAKPENAVKVIAGIK